MPCKTCHPKHPRRKTGTVLAIPDLHFPYQHPRALEFIRKAVDTYQPDVVVQLGDLVDHHRLSRWPAEPGSSGLMEEIEAASEWIAELADICPTMEITMGNHDIRLVKRVKLAGIPAHWLRSFTEVFGCPSGWTFTDGVTINGIYYFHGDGFSGARAAVAAATAFRCSTVMAHTHTFAGITYMAAPTGVIFGANAGCLIDDHTLAFEYAKLNPNRPVLSLIVVQNGIPTLVPMPT